MLKSVLRKSADADIVRVAGLRLRGEERRQRNKMFSVVTGTWNPVSGCLHNCRYCWARKLAETKLKNSTRYREGSCHD